MDTIVPFSELRRSVRPSQSKDLQSQFAQLQTQLSEVKSFTEQKFAVPLNKDEVIQKLQAEISNLRGEFGKVQSSLLNVSEELNKKSAELESYKLRMNEMNTEVNKVKVHTDLTQTKIFYQLEALRNFLQEGIRQNPKAYIENADLNEAVYKYAKEHGVQIEHWEVSGLMKQLGIEWKKSNGKCLYRGIEFVS